MMGKKVLSFFEFMQKLKIQYFPCELEVFYNILDYYKIIIPVDFFTDFLYSNDWRLRNYFFCCLNYQQEELKREYAFIGINDSEYVVGSSAAECLFDLTLSGDEIGKLLEVFKRRRQGILRRDLAIALGKSGDRQLIPFFQRKLRTINEVQTRLGVLQALLELGDKELLDTFLEGLDSSLEYVRYITANVLLELLDNKKFFLTKKQYAYLQNRLDREKSEDVLVVLLEIIFTSPAIKDYGKWIKGECIQDQKHSLIQKAAVRAVIEREISVPLKTFDHLRLSEDIEDNKLFWKFIRFFHPKEILRFYQDIPSDDAVVVEWIKCFFKVSLDSTSTKLLMNFFEKHENLEIKYLCILALGFTGGNDIIAFFQKQIERTSAAAILASLYAGMILCGDHNYILPLLKLCDYSSTYACRAMFDLCNNLDEIKTVASAEAIQLFDFKKCLDEQSFLLAVIMRLNMNCMDYRFGN